MVIPHLTLRGAAAQGPKPTKAACSRPGLGCHGNSFSSLPEDETPSVEQWGPDPEGHRKPGSSLLSGQTWMTSQHDALPHRESKLDTHKMPSRLCPAPSPYPLWSVAVTFKPLYSSGPAKKPEQCWKREREAACVCGEVVGVGEVLERAQAGPALTFPPGAGAHGGARPHPQLLAQHFPPTLCSHTTKHLTGTSPDNLRCIP